MTIPFWTDIIPHWDTLFLGGTQMPGVWKIEGDKERAADKAKVAGQDGYTLTNKGYNGGAIKAIGRLWTGEQINEIYALLNAFDPEFVTAAAPYDIYHPSCEVLWITHVWVKKLAIKGPEKGILTVTMDLDQWFPETKPSRSSKKVKGFDGVATQGAPLSPEDLELGPPTL